MRCYELTVAVGIHEVGSGAWRAEGKDVALFMEAGSRAELIRYVVSAVQALGEWVVESKPQGRSTEEYCASIGIDCRAAEMEDGLELAVRELQEEMDRASEVLSVTQRIPGG